MSRPQVTSMEGSKSIFPTLTNNIDSHKNSFPISFKPFFPVLPPTRSSEMAIPAKPLSTHSTAIGTTTSSLVVPLSWTLVGDVSIAALVTGVVAPFLTVVDKALVQRSAGSHTILESAWASCRQIITHPIQHVKSPTFLWMWATYASTYTAANVLDSITKHEYTSTTTSSSSSSNSSSFSTMTIFLGTTAVNTTASLSKDRAYAHLFGSPSPTVGVPLAAYGFWMARDFTVIGSSFILPEHVAKILSSSSGQHYHGHDHYQSMMPVAQLLTPVLAQTIAGPLHFVGLDVFNYRHQTLMDRVSRLRQSVASVIAARMVRILPGYGIAGVWNRKLRNTWKDSWWTIQTITTTTSYHDNNTLLATSPTVKKLN